MRITCPQGHEWDAPDGLSPHALAGSDVCPICTAWHIEPRTAEMRLKAAVTATMSPQPAEWPSLPGFHLIRELGRGGMGLVYLARQMSLDRLVAIKMILNPTSASARDRGRFHNEVQAIAQLQHPNIVQVYEAGEVNGRAYFTMEYISGGNLDQLVRQRILGARPAAELLELLAGAMGYAHKSGVVHRDLKPGNVMLQPVGAGDETHTALTSTEPLRTGEIALTRSRPYDDATVSPWRALIPKIGDFGLARRLDSGTGPDGKRLTESNMVVGTSGYMSPEQALGYSREVGPTADIYSLGAVLYECLTGRPPFVGDTWLETLHQVRYNDPIPLRRLQPNVPRDLETICLKCLHKDTARRYPTAEELADDLRRFLNGELIRARPTPWSERAAKWVKRHPVTATMATTGILAIAAIVALSIWYLLNLEHALTRARMGEQEAQEQTLLVQREKETVETQKKKVEESEQKAKKKRILALEILREYLDRFTRDRLLDQPGLKELRGDLLAQAVKDLELFRNEDTDDAELRVEQAALCGSLGRFNKELGNTKKAIEFYNQAKQIFQKLASENPGETDYLLEVSVCDYNIGAVHAANQDLENAESCYREAYKAQKELSVKYSNRIEYRQELGGTCNALGVLAHQQGNIEEAEIYQREAVELRSALCKSISDRPAYQYDLAISHNNFGLLQVSLGNYSAALDAYKNAQDLLIPILELYRDIERKDKEYPQYVLAAVYSNRGITFLTMGEWDNASDAFSQAKTHLEKLHRLHSNVGQYTNDLARCYQHLGNVHRSKNELDKAERQYAIAKKFREDLVADNPDVALYECELAGVWNNLGVLQWMQKKHVDSEKSFDTSVRILRTLSSKYKSVARYQIELADTWNNQGILYRTLNRFDDADRVFALALTIQKELQTSNPRQLEFNLAVGRTYFNRANNELDQVVKEPKHIPAAITWYSSTIESLTPIVERQPRHEEARQYLRELYNARAIIFSLQGKHQASVGEWEKALKFDGGDRPRMRLVYAAALARAERYDDAAKEIKEGFAASKKDGEMCLLAAAGSALCSTRNPRAAQQAVDYLELADKAGYFHSAERVTKLSKDRDFQAIRDFPAFRAFVQKLEERLK